MKERLAPKGANSDDPDQHRPGGARLSAGDREVMAEIRRGIGPSLSEAEAYERFAELVRGGDLSGDRWDRLEGVQEGPLGGGQDPGPVVDHMDPDRCAEGRVVDEIEAAGGEVA